MCISKPVPPADAEKQTVAPVTFSATPISVTILTICYIVRTRHTFERGPCSRSDMRLQTELATAAINSTETAPSELSGAFLALSTGLVVEHGVATILTSESFMLRLIYYHPREVGEEAILARWNDLVAILAIASLHYQIGVAS